VSVINGDCLQNSVCVMVLFS